MYMYMYMYIWVYMHYMNCGIIYCNIIMLYYVILGDIAATLSAVSDNATQQYGFAYDQSSGYYYDSNTGFYYDQVRARVCTYMCVCVCVCVCVWMFF